MSDEVAETLRAALGRSPEEEATLRSDYSGSLSTYVRDNMPYIQRAWASYHHPGAIDGARGCIRACMIHLEQQGKLGNTFKQPFRRRKPWRLD